MEGLRWLRQAAQKISLYLCTISMFVLIPMMLLTTFDVLGRAVWARPLSGAVEISSYMLAVFILSGLAYTQQVKGNVRVEMLVDKLPRRLRYLVESLTTLLSLVIVVLLTWQGWLEGIADPTVSDMLRIPRWPFKLLVSVAGFLLSLELVFDLLDTLKNIGKRRCHD
ncbi:MAG: TRAP transporter small permease [Desulfohalobiaceae bacterium]|nr:TRAP transporter small permease [Desulfohalobiaceae bacterium]